MLLFQVWINSWITYEKLFVVLFCSSNQLHSLSSRLNCGRGRGLRKAISFLDPLIVIGCSGLSAEIYHALNKPLIKSKFQSITICSACFAISATSVFSYRMILSTWHDTFCLFFALTSTLLLIYERKKLALIALTLAFLNQYHWCIIYSTLVAPVITLNHLKIISETQIQELFPPILSSKNERYSLLVPIFIPLSLIGLQKIALSLQGFSSTNSNALHRIGIDTASNIFHGGLAGSLQFLGGIRISLCVQNDFLKSLNLETVRSAITGSVSAYSLQQIFSFNCILAIVSSLLISIASLFGFIFMMKYNPRTRWFAIPILYSLVFTYSFLQQSTSTHLQGRSLLFILFMGQGLCYLLFNFKIPALAKNSNLKLEFLRNIFALPICAGIIINSIRLSLLLGVNGQHPSEIEAFKRSIYCIVMQLQIKMKRTTPASTL